MLKFVVLGLLALGCYAEEHKKMTFGTYGTTGFGHDGKLIGIHGNDFGVRHFGDRTGFGIRYGLGYGIGHGHDFGRIGYGSTGHGHIGYGTTGLGRIGYGVTGLGANRMYYGHGTGFGGLYGLGGGFGGYYGIMPSYHYVQPVTTGYISQPVVHTGVVDNTVRVGAVTPALNFLTAHKSDAHQEVVQAAVHQLGRTVEYKSMGHQEHPITPQVVEVEASESPLHLHFKTKSSSVSLSQSHEQAATPEVQVTQSQDEPVRLVHEIQKPIIQEVRELITPYRQVTQEINPVVEAVHTVVTKAEGQRQNYVAPSTLSIGRSEVSQAVAAPVTTVAHQQIGTVAAQPIGTVSTIAAQPITTVAQPVHVGYEQIVAQPIVSSVATQPIVGFEEKIVASPAVSTYGVGFSTPSTIVGSFEPAKIGFGTTKFTESKILPSTTTTFGGYRFGGDASSFQTGFENRVGFENRIGSDRFGITGDRLENQEIRKKTF